LSSSANAADRPGLVSQTVNSSASSEHIIV
jgi:hypothetical protein